MESKTTPKVFQENQAEGVTQPWNRPVKFKSTQTPAGVKSLMVGTSGSKDP